MDAGTDDVYPVEQTAPTPDLDSSRRSDPPKVPPAPPPQHPQSISTPEIFLEDDPFKEKRQQKELQFNLVSAIETGNLELLKQLIASGVDVNCFILYVKRPLMFAAEQLPIVPEIIEALLDAGADMNLLGGNRGNMATLHVIAKYNMVDIAEILCEGTWCCKCDIDVRDNGGLTPLHYAVSFHCLKMVSYLLNRGADISLIDDQGRSCLHRSCEADDIEMVRNLLKHNIEVNTCDKFGWTPLFHCSFFQQTDLLKVLIENGADLRCLDVRGNSVLNYACYVENSAINETVHFPLLVTMDTSINYYNRTRSIPPTALNKMLSRRRMELYENYDMRLELVVLLLNAGADSRTCTTDGTNSPKFDVLARTRMYLILAGADLDLNDPWVMWPNPDVPDWVAWFRGQVTKQYSLKRQCRRAVRDCLAQTRNIAWAVDQLTLPRSIREYLKLADFDEVMSALNSVDPDRTSNSAPDQDPH